MAVELGSKAHGPNPKTCPPRVPSKAAASLHVSSREAFRAPLATISRFESECLGTLSSQCVAQVPSRGPPPGSGSVRATAPLGCGGRGPERRPPQPPSTRGRASKMAEGCGQRRGPHSVPRPLCTPPQEWTQPCSRTPARALAKHSEGFAPTWAGKATLSRRTGPGAPWS